MMNTLGMNQTVDQLEIDHKSAVFRELGTEFTPGNWDFIAEYVQSKVSNSLAAKAEQYFVSAGYRFGRLTTALTWEHNQQAPSFNALNSFPSNASCFEPGIGLVPGLCTTYVTAVLTSQVAQDRYYDLSLRYDLTPHVALKLDYTAYDSGAAGAAKKSSANFVSGGVTFYF
jgi:predicted porin